MNDRIFAVDLQSGYNDLLHVGLSQYDVGVVLEFDVFDGGAAAVFPSGTTAKIQGVRPSGVGFDISCTLSGNVVTVSTVTDMTGEAGSFPVEIRFTASGVDVGTVNFNFAIEKAAHPDGTIDADITHEQDIVDKINQILIQTTPDTTLSEAGVAADSKTVGDNIRRIDGQIGTLGTRITNVEDDISYQSQRVDRTNKIKAPVIWEEANGNPAVFDDGADGMYIKDLTLTLTPSQDLHGYDYAWAGGNGKNLLNINGTVTDIGVSHSVSGESLVLTPTTNRDIWKQVSVNIPIELNVSYTFSIEDMTVPTGYSSRVIIVHDNSSLTETLEAPNSLTFTISSGSASVDIIFRTSQTGNPQIGENFTFTKPMLRLSSTTATYEPYSNICPISGAESVTVKRTGKNLLENIGTSTTNNGVTFTVNADGSISTSGTATGLAYFWVTGSGFYTDLNLIDNTVLTGCPEGGGAGKYGLALRQYPTSPNSTFYDYGSGQSLSRVEGTVRFAVAIMFWSGQSANGLTFYPMIRPVSISDDTYEPYSGIDTNVDFGQTIYGGTVNPILWDLQGGDIVFDRKVFSVGDLTWSKQSWNIFKATPDNVTGSANYDMSDTFRRNSVADSAMENGDYKLTVAGTLYVKLEGFGTAAGFKAAYADAKFCAKLAHSEIGAMYPGDRREITMAYLDNVITAQPDKGNVTNIKATYPADTKAYIDKAIAAISG